MIALAAIAVVAPPAVLSALQASLPAGAHVEVLGYRGGACEPVTAELRTPFAASGTATVRIAGAGCAGWAFVEARVTAEALVLTRDVRAGEALEGAVEPAMREVRAGHTLLATLTPGAIASHHLRRGEAVESGSLRDEGPAPGQPVRVVLRIGAIALEQPGRALPCVRGRACALLPSGKRVEGRLEGGVLLVEAP
jgi:hypothetical protein